MNGEDHRKKVPGQAPTGAKLPQGLQDTMNNDEKLWEVLYEGKGPDTTENSSRYAAYAARARTILRAAHRYIAYTSDIGESFRPIAHPYLVRGAYAVSWMYLAGDVANEGRKAYVKNKASAALSQESTDQAAKSAVLAKQDDVTASVAAAAKDIGSPAFSGVAPIHDYRTVMVQRAVFQSIASMGLPAFTIHSIVKYSGRALKSSANKTIRTWGPIGLGLGAVPFLPFIFDEPVEHAVEWTFHKGFEALGGKSAVEDISSKKEL